MSTLMRTRAAGPTRSFAVSMLVLLVMLAGQAPGPAGGSEPTLGPWVSSGGLTYPYRVDFGTVPVDTPFETTVPLRNSGAEAVMVKELSPT